MFEGTVGGVPRGVGEAYMSLRNPYAWTALRGPGAGMAGFYRSGELGGARARRSRRAGELEPDTREAPVALDAPAVRHLVDEHQPEAAGLDLTEHLLAPGRQLARAPGVADLDARGLVVAAGEQPDRLVLAQAGVAHAVGDELGDEQQQDRLLGAVDQAAASDRAAGVAGRARSRPDHQVEIGIGDHGRVRSLGFPRP